MWGGGEAVNPLIVLILMIFLCSRCHNNPFSVFFKILSLDVIAQFQTLYNIQTIVRLCLRIWNWAMTSRDEILKNTLYKDCESYYLQF